MAKIITISELKPGMMILQIAEQNGPVRIRKSGMVTSEAMVQGLSEMGVQKLEIDPEQSVELETTEQKTSQTQWLLQQENGRRNIDEPMADQFNRSLFMPSVQAIPSRWQYYAKSALTIASVSFLGLLVGWSLARYPMWMATPPKPVTALTETKTEAENSPKEVPAEPVSQPVQVKSEVASSEPEQAVVNTESQVTNTQPRTPETEPQDVIQAEQRGESDISPELLQKFQQAVNALEQDGGVPETVEVDTPEEVPRIDQLPAWVLTQLPSMSFSTHMYASDPADRWVKVNDLIRTEGDYIADNLQIQRIAPQHVILTYEGQMFSMPALTDW